MKRIFEWIGGFALIAFSFYFTDKVSLLVASKSELMTEIKAVSANYEIEATNAIINSEDNTIIPGKFGRKIDAEQSYLNMHDFGSFNESYLIYDLIKPQTSLEENKDKYILRGNPENRKVSLIIENNDIIERYLTKENIKYNIIINHLETDNINGEIINGSSSIENFKKIDKITDNKHICIKDYSNEMMCKKHDYYILSPQIYLQNTNVAEIKNQISSGSIILISNATKLENFKIILNDINYKDLKIVYISELIDERA